MHTTQHSHVNETLHVSQQVYLHNHTHTHTDTERSKRSSTIQDAQAAVPCRGFLSLSWPFSLLGLAQWAERDPALSSPAAPATR